jgi:hypothetical protein
MSEYQYYEFQAIDHPLDQRAMAALRSITSRAQITPTSLINVYHFGDFKGDPDRLMDEYFDAFLYVANWGTHRFMLRLPDRLFDLATAELYCVPYVLNARAGLQHVVLDFNSDDEGEEDFEGGEGWMASLIPLRADLLAGDVRCLYLAWLAGVESDAVDDDQPEPPVPPGLGNLSAPLRRFADFLRLDPDLIEVAARASTGRLSEGPSPAELAAWVSALTEVEKDRSLLRLLQGETTFLAAELLQRFRRDHAQRTGHSLPGRPDGAEPRSAGSLREERDILAAERRRQAEKRAAAEKARREREQAEERAKRERERAAEKARREREQAATRARILDELAGRETDLWLQVEAAIQTRRAEQYDHVMTLLRDLCDLGKRSGGIEAVAARIRELRQRHSSKSRLIQRLDQAGLPR